MYNEQVNNFVRFNIVRQNLSNNMSHLLSASDGLICQNANREDLCKTVKLSMLFASSSNLNNY